MRAGQRRLHQPNATGAGKALVDHLTAWHGQGTPYVQQSLFTTTGDLVVGGVGETMLFQGMEYATPTRLPVGANGQGLVADSTQAVGMAWKYGIPVTVLRTADSAARNSGNTGSTLTNDDATGGTLQFAIGTSATETYFVEAYLYFNAANITMDIKVGWNATSLPAGATANWGMQAGLITIGPNTLGGFMGVSAAATASTIIAIGATLNSGSSAGGTSGLALAGTFFGGGTAGNITFAWAQVTPDAGNLVLTKGSFLRVTRLAA